MQYLSQRLALEPSEARDGERPRDPLARDQRERVLAATEQLIAEKGCAGTTIEAIVKEAGVSSVTFYDHFADKEECFVAAFDRAVGETRAELIETVPQDLPWPDRVRAGLAALLATIDAEPARARLCLVEAQKGGPRMRARYDEVLDGIAVELSDPLGQAIAGGLAWLLRERLELGGGGSVHDLLPRMTEVVLAPQPTHG
ncbi:MAG TPA: TetR/AcrR family transcriptional regulator [Solirubrobacterales bacterium]|nr:TetR/AcrR family transcriptional regulator [Solirubrobacterales bacterium]